MPENFGKHIEELGKTAAENYIPGIKAPDWSLIERKLDIEMPVKEKKRRRFIIFWLALAGIITAAGLFVVLNNDQQKQELAKKELKETNNQLTKPTEPKEAETNLDNTLITSPKTSVTKGNENKKAENEIETTRKQIKETRNKKEDISKTESKPSNQSQSITPATLNETEPNKQVVNESSSEKLTENKTAAFSINPVEEEQAAIIGPIYHQETKQNDTTTIPVTKIAKDKTKKEKGFELGITYGADMSTVKFKHNAPLGHNIGITAAYNFSSHLSIRSGLIYTQKNYKANGEDYTYKIWYTMPPAANSVKLMQAEGYCNMYEIPLSIRYTVNPTAKTVFFVSAGASSYFMKKESYNYLIQYNTWAPQQKSRIINEPTNYIFGIADFSVGIRKQVSKKLFFEIQPFAKVPLNGVGNGNILLSSFGTYGNLIYKIPYSKNKRQ